MASVRTSLGTVDRKALLMLSAGKDSVALALAIAELGVKIPCFTFKPGPKDTEHELAARLCRRLGLDHRTVEMPRDPTYVRTNLERFFEGSSLPCGDHATIGYAMTVAAAGLDSGGVLDGGGNDPYMGFLLSASNQTKLRYRIRGRHLAATVARVSRIDSPVSYVARSRAAALLPGRNFRYHELKSIYPGAIPTADFWYKETEVPAPQVGSAMMTSRVRHTEAARNNLKGRLVAEACGLAALFPFCDTGIADYYFNLPKQARIDERRGVNKVLLRRLLMEKLGYDPADVGDGYFAFDGPAFLMDNAEFVRDEISSCKLWTADASALARKWLDLLPKRPFLWHALYSLFMVSGWHNHSRFVAAR